MAADPQQQWQAPGWPPAGDAVAPRPQRRRFLPVAATWALLFIAVMGIMEPNGRTTWLDALGGAGTIGIVAGLIAVAFSRPRGRPSRLLDFAAGLATFGLISSVLRRFGR